MKYEIGEKGDWGNLSVAETEGIEHGLADMNAGRGYADEDVKAFINNKLKDFRMIDG